jgi:hypothetical protein
MHAVVGCLLVCTVLISPSWTQSTSTGGPNPGAPQGHPPGTLPPATPAEMEMQKRMAKQRIQDRFVHIKKDTDHLLELATQLKKSVDQASDQTLSLEVIRKAEQIEKLAKQIRQKMASE